MNLVDPEVFFLRHLPLYFRECMNQGFSNTSRDSWLNVERPINIYKSLAEFLLFLRSGGLGLQPKVVLALLNKYFVVPMDVITDVKPAPKETQDVGYFLIGQLPQAHRLVLQVMLRCIEADVKLSINRRQSMQTELLLLHRMLSYYRMLAQQTDSHEDLPMDFVFHFLLKECSSKESLDFIKSLLARSELLQRFRLQIELKGNQFKNSDKFIQSYEEVPMRSVDRKELQQLIASTPRANKQAAMEVQAAPIRAGKTPEKKRSASKVRQHLIQQSAQKLIRIPQPQKLVQRTIFQLKHKKFVPKRIQYTLESTVASSCSLVAKNQQCDQMLSRNLFLQRHGKASCQMDASILVQATPVKRDRHAPVQPTVKKQVDPFESGRYLRTTRASR